jgi:hypothetical protein
MGWHPPAAALVIVYEALSALINAAYSKTQTMQTYLSTCCQCYHHCRCLPRLLFNHTGYHGRIHMEVGHFLIPEL